MSETAKTTQETARSLKNCLGYLLEEAMDAKLLMVALHLKLALDEASDAAELADYKTNRMKRAS